MKADIDFDHGTITLICSKCRRKFPKRIAEIGTDLRFKCKCSNIVCWEGDLNWVTCYAHPYRWEAPAPTPRSK